MTLEEFNELLAQSLQFYNSFHTSEEIDEGVSGGLGAIRYDKLQTLSEAQKATARKNIGIKGGSPVAGDGGNFEAVYDFTTAAEIEEAYQAGKIITVNYNGLMCYLRERTSANLFVFAAAPFYRAEFQDMPAFFITCEGTTWQAGLTRIETLSNKVTTINENSTNKQYPSAKAVFDFVNENGGGGGGVSDTAALAALIETDMLPAVTTLSGAILTDASGNIPLRY